MAPSSRGDESAPMPVSLLEIVDIERIEPGGERWTESSSTSSTEGTKAAQVDEDVLFATKGRPWSFGYGSRAFGGTILAVGVQAAYASIVCKLGKERANEYTIFSFQGSFLSSTALNTTLRIRVIAVRTSSSFVTRVVQGFQIDAKGNERNTFVATADFVRRGQRTVKGGTFSAKAFNPATKAEWEPPHDLANVTSINAARREEYQKGVQSGALTPDPKLERAIYLESLMWKPISSLQEYRPLPTSPIHETVTAFDIDRPTRQDGLHITEKKAADYLRWTEDPHILLQANEAKVASSGWTLASLNACSLALSLDYYLAGIALFMAKIPRAAATFVSLDFSLRFHKADIDATQWHLREVRAIAGGQGRKFSEASVWHDGQLVATISQQCFCRPVERPAQDTISQSNPLAYATTSVSAAKDDAGKPVAPKASKL
ncbi:hypothetical protein V8E36_005007 [Tilletia maclaganii]